MNRILYFTLLTLLVSCFKNDNTSTYKWMLEEASLSISEKVEIEDYFYGNEYGKIIKLKLIDNDLSNLIDKYNFKKIDVDKAKNNIIQINSINVHDLKSDSVYFFQKKKYKMISNMLLDFENKYLVLEVLHPDMGGDF